MVWRKGRAESYDEISRTCWDLSQVSVTYYALTNHLDTQLPRTFPESFIPLFILGLLGLERHNFISHMDFIIGISTVKYEKINLKISHQ